MKVLFKAKTEKGEQALLEWDKNNSEVVLISGSPVVIKEEFKDSSIDYMLRKMEKMYKMPENTFKNNTIYTNSVKNKLLRKAIKKLKVTKQDIEIEVK